MAQKIQDYLQITAAAEFLGVSPQTLRNWEQGGKIRCCRHPLNGYRLFRKVDLDRLLKAIEKSAQVQKRRG